MSIEYVSDRPPSDRRLDELRVLAAIRDKTVWALWRHIATVSHVGGHPPSIEFINAAPKRS